MWWLALTFPDLGLAIHTRGQAIISPDTALALVADGRVLACNAVAREHGVLPGQRTANAVALCARLRFLRHEPEAEQRLLRQLAEACFVVTPTVVMTPQQTVLLEVGGCLGLFKGIHGVLRQLRQALRPFHLPYQLAQGHTPKAADILVRAGLGEASLAWAPPLPVEAVLPLLNQAPPDVLPWPEPLHKKAQRLHLQNIGELLALPRAALSKRLGIEATHYLAQLRGDLPDPQAPITLSDDFQATLHFLEGISHVEGMRFPMKRLLDEFCVFLRQRQLSCARFQWRLAHQDKSRQSLTIASARGEPQAARFMQLTELKLEHLRLSAPVEVITLIATEFQPQSDTRLSLLPSPGAEDSKGLELLDRLRARLGQEACHGLMPLPSHVPEAAQTTTPHPGAMPDSAESTPHTRWRPFWLWPEPKALRIMEGRLWWQGELTLLSLPERISLPWWEDGGTRDYYLARHDNGGHYWLFYCWERHQWFCHGLFG